MIENFFGLPKTKMLYEQEDKYIYDGGYDGRRVSGNHGTDCLGWG